MEIEIIIEKLKEQLKKTTWYMPLRYFLMSQDFENIIKKLFEFSKENRRFTPQVKNLFKPFEIYDYDKSRIIFLFDKPYNKLNWSNGIPIACPNVLKKTSEFKYFENALGRKLERDLSDFGDNSVLLLHSAFTTDISDEGSLLHYKIWQPFIRYIFDLLSRDSKKIFILIGENAHTYSSMIDKSNPTYLLENIPSEFSFNIKWDYKNIFNEINELLIKNNELPIKW